jgi:hypothetical protein
VKIMARMHAARKTPFSSRHAPAMLLRRRKLPVRASFLAAIALLLFLHSCQSADPVAREKERTLTPDERYLVDYYMKIIEFEKVLQDNPASREEKRKELDENLDRERIRRTLAELEKRPERWLAIYNRINELQYRALQNTPSGKD